MPHISLDGIFIIDKPQKKTSFDIVRLVRQHSGALKVGHGGTLDPGATGVLPICVGQATRVAEFLSDANKLYRAEIELGVTTSTYDADGEVIQRHDSSQITISHVEECLASFRGVIQQQPPMYSAVRVGGKHLYELARAGVEVERKPRKVHIYRLDVLEMSLPLITLEIECSKGTYIRSLAHDLGQKLGCGAYLKGLVRLQMGPFPLSKAITVTQMVDAFSQDCWRPLLHPMDAALVSIKPVIMENREMEQLVRSGVDISIPGGARAASEEPYPSYLKGYQTLSVPPDHESYRRAYSSEGKLIALLRSDSQQTVWHPFKVFT